MQEYSYEEQCIIIYSFHIIIIRIHTHTQHTSHTKRMQTCSLDHIHPQQNRLYIPAIMTKHDKQKMIITKCNTLLIAIVTHKRTPHTVRSIGKSFAVVFTTLRLTVIHNLHVSRGYWVLPRCLLLLYVCFCFCVCKLRTQQKTVPSHKTHLNPFAIIL